MLCSTAAAANRCSLVRLTDEFGGSAPLIPLRLLLNLVTTLCSETPTHPF